MRNKSGSLRLQRKEEQTIRNLLISKSLVRDNLKKVLVEKPDLNGLHQLRKPLTSHFYPFYQLSFWAFQFPNHFPVPWACCLLAYFQPWRIPLLGMTRSNEGYYFHHCKTSKHKISSRFPWCVIFTQNLQSLKVLLFHRILKNSFAW